MTRLAQPVAGLEGAATVELHQRTRTGQGRGQCGAGPARGRPTDRADQPGRDPGYRSGEHDPIGGCAGRAGPGESPARGVRFLRAARLLTTRCRHTMAALSDGRIDEYRASLAVAGTSFLSPTDRRRWIPNSGRCWSGCRIARCRLTAARIGYRLDPQQRSHTAAQLSGPAGHLRPAPDTMAILSALLPARAGVAIYTVLDSAAATARAAGDIRSRGQVMADTLLDRVTGAASADEVPMQVQLIVAEDTLAGEATPGSDRRLRTYPSPDHPSVGGRADQQNSADTHPRRTDRCHRPPLSCTAPTTRTASSGQGTVANTSGATGNGTAPAAAAAAAANDSARCNGSW